MRTSAAACLLVVAAACGDGGDARPDAGACDMTRPWASAPDLALGVGQEMVAVAVDGKIYVLGGFLAGQPGNVVQVFDTEKCTWSMGPTMPKDIHHSNATVHDGTIYVVGVMREGSPYTPLGDTWSWNPATEAGWRIRTPMPAGTERGSSVAGVIDGKIYVAGGLRNGAVTDVSIYDPMADTWTQGPPMPMPRDHACGDAIGGKLYVVGGRIVNPFAPTATVFELTPGVGWIERAPAPTPHAGAGCGAIGGRLIVAGGEGNPDPSSRGVFAQVEAYDPVQNTWEALAPMPTPRHGAGAAVWNGRLHILAGGDQQGAGAVATHEILTP